MQTQKKGKFSRFISGTILCALSISLLGINPESAFAAHPVINTSVNCGALSSPDLSTHLSSEVDSRLGSLSPSTALSLWTTKSTTASVGPWVRNTGVWTGNLNFSGVSPFNSADANRRAGTLVSPRHIISAHHYPMSVGTKITFVDPSNVPHERTITGVTQISGTDIDVSLLDSDVPDSITYYPVVNKTALLPRLHRFNYNDLKYPPIISLNQEDKAFVHAYDGYTGWNGISSAANTFFHIAYGPIRNMLANTSTITNFDKRKDFSDILITGDSGDANFMVINGKLVFMGANHGAGSMPYVGAFIPEINSAMNSLGGGYQLTEMNLSCFNLYSINTAPRYTLDGAYQKAELAGQYDDYTGNVLIDENVYFDSTNPFLKFTVSDPDGDLTRVETVSTPASYFSLVQTGGTYELALSQPLSFTNKPAEDSPGSKSHLYNIKITDNNQVPATTNLPIYFTIKDNNKPLFSAASYNFTIPENSIFSTIVGSAPATKQNSEDTLTYSLTTNPNNAFAISPTNGQISVANAAAMDYETTQTFNLVVTASATLSPSRQALSAQSGTSVAKVTVSLTDKYEPGVTPSYGAYNNNTTPTTGNNNTAPAPVYTPAPYMTYTPAPTPSYATTAPSTTYNANQAASYGTYGTAQSSSAAQGQVYEVDLKVGSNHPAVKTLQQFLNANGYTVALSGSGSKGNETTYFGPATRVALMNFQKNNGIYPAQGFYGPVTRKAVQAKSNGAQVQTTVSTPVIQSTVTTPAIQTTVATIPSVVTVGQPIKFGSSGAEVKKLRVVLRGLGYLDPYGTPGTPSSAANETMYFGETTVTALKKYQCDAKIACSGTIEETGWGAVGPKTKAALKL